MGKVFGIIMRVTLIAMSMSLMGASSCTSAPIIATRAPVDSNRYELPFRFTCNGKPTLAMGTAVCQYKEGDLMTIEIKAPDSRGEIQVRSCRHGRAMDIDQNKTWQKVEWVQYTREDSCPIEIAVTTRDSGVQIGKIYPYVFTPQFPKMAGKSKLYCWESEKVEDFEGQGSCQFPTGIRVNGTMLLDPTKAGAFLIKKQCGDTLGPTKFPVGSKSVDWVLRNDNATYCPISMAVKYDDGTIEESEVNLEFFDARYRMLPPPIMGQKKEKSYACAPQDFEFIDLNDHMKGNGLFAGKCISDGWDENNMATAIAWDAAGRVSYAFFTKGQSTWVTPHGTRVEYQIKTDKSRVILP
jgi:hypothetical protein